MLKKYILLIVWIFILFSFSGCNKEAEQISQNIITSENMMKDLKRLYRNVCIVHPLLKDKEFKEKYDDLYEKLYERISEPMTVEEFYFVVVEALMPFNDAHTNARYSGHTDFIPLSLLWTDEGMIINKDSKKLRKGDKILKIGSKAPDEIISEIKEVVPSENDYWLKFIASHILPQKLYLWKFGVVNKDKVNIKVEHFDGDVEEIELAFESYLPHNSQETSKVKPYKYKIMKDKNLGVFQLDQCIYTNEYISLMNEFFKEVRENNITKVAVDLRRNTGGDLTVLNEFLSYVDVNEYEFFRDSLEEYNLVSKAYHRDDKLYKDKIYILTSNAVMSAANTFASVIKYNNIGKIVGQCTGNSPSHYGHIIHFDLLNSKIKISVSQTHWIWQGDKNSSNTLEPDVYVPVTRKDIVEDNDAVMEWVIND